MKQHYKCPLCDGLLLIEENITAEIKCPKCTHHGVLSTYKQVVKRDRFCSSCSHKWSDFFCVGDYIPSDFICPNCGTKNESTVLIGADNRNGIFIPGVLELINDEDKQWVGPNSTFILKKGINTIGRKAKEPKAQILLPTRDPYMSRCHIKMEVNVLPSGVIEHYLVDNGSVNGVYLNNEKLCPGQIIGLEINDIIKLGHTSLLFRACTPFDLEQTI